MREWQPDIITSEAAVPAPDPEIEWIRDRHTDLLATGLREARELLAEIGWPLEAVPDHVKEFGLLINMVASTLLVGRDSLLTDYVATQTKLMAEYGAPDEVGQVFLKALDTAIDGKAPHASESINTTLAEL